MKTYTKQTWILSLLIMAAVIGAYNYSTLFNSYDIQVSDYAQQMLDEGKEIFRYDTFGDEAFWGDALKLHTAISGEANGGVGGGLSPVGALNLGLKVDVEKLPQEVTDGISDGSINLEDPATTLALLKLNSVVGLKGIFSGDELTSIGIQCALCHSTVDDSFTDGIGVRLDGWANRDLDVGAIIALSPDVSPFTNLLGVDEETFRSVANSWGPGKFDASLLLDGLALGPDGNPAPVLIPPAFGLAGINLHTYEGWGSVSHWNALVANLEMGGKGTFYDPRLNDADKFPVASANGFGNVRNSSDLITSKLPALQFYQLALPAPSPPEGFYDAGKAAAGEIIFNGKAECATCHVPPLYTEPGWNMHTAEEIGIDDFQANRGPDGYYRTTPLKGLWSHMKGGFYHDGRFATLTEVVEHYNNHFSLALSEQETEDLVEFLKSLGDTEDGITDVTDQDKIIIPNSFELTQNYPNPFNPTTTINYSLPKTSSISLRIYNINGQEIKTLVNTTQNAGSYSVIWDGRNNFNQQVSSGIYFYSIKSGNFVASKKMILLK